MVVYGVFKGVNQSQYTEPRYWGSADDYIELLELYESEDQANEMCERLRRDVPIYDESDECIPDEYYYVEAYTVKRANGSD